MAEHTVKWADQPINNKSHTRVLISGYYMIPAVSKSLRYLFCAHFTGPEKLWLCLCSGKDARTAGYEGVLQK
jgi:hypothetical protein